MSGKKKTLCLKKISNQKGGETKTRGPQQGSQPSRQSQQRPDTKNEGIKKIKELYKKHKNNISGSNKNELKQILKTGNLDDFVSKLDSKQIDKNKINKIYNIIKKYSSNLKEEDKKKLNKIKNIFKSQKNKTPKHIDKKQTSTPNTTEDEVNSKIKEIDKLITKKISEIKNEKDKLEREVTFSNLFLSEKEKENIGMTFTKYENILKENYNILEIIKGFNKPIFKKGDGSSKLDELISLTKTLENLENQEKDLKNKKARIEKEQEKAKIETKRKILSWNVNKWNSRNIVNEYVNQITRINPDIILLQQNDLRENDLKNKLPSYENILMSNLNEDGTSNVILSIYKFSAQSELDLPQINAKKNSNVSDILFHDCEKQKKGFINSFFGGMNGNIPNDEMEVVKKGHNNMLIAQFKIKDDKILNVINVEFLKNIENNLKSELNDDCKNKKENIYENIRNKQFEKLYDILIDSSKIETIFGGNFESPNYMITGGDFHSVINSDILEKFKKNYNFGSNNLDLNNNTQYIGCKLDIHSQIKTRLMSRVDESVGPVVLDIKLPIFSEDIDSIKTRPITELEKIILDDKEDLSLKKSSNTKTKTNKPINKKEDTLKLPGLDDIQNQKYNELRKKDFNNLNDDDKQTLKILKDISEKHLENKKVNLNKNLKNAYQGLAEIKESPCPSLDYLQCRKITLDKLFEMIETILHEDKKHRDTTHARIEELERKVGDKCNDKDASVNKGEKDILIYLEEKEKDWNKYQELLAKNKSKRDGIDNNNLEKYKDKHLKGKLKLTNEEKDKLIKLRQKDKDGILKLSECSELKLLRHSKRNHLIQDLKVNHLNGYLKKEEINNKLEEINKLNEHLGINERHEMTGKDFKSVTHQDNSKTTTENKYKSNTKKGINKEEIIKNIEEFLSKDEFKTELIMFRLYKLKNLNNLSDDDKLKFLKKILESTSFKAKMELSRLKSLTTGNNSIYEKYEELLNSINEALNQSISNISNLITKGKYKDIAIEIKKIIKNENIKSSIIFSELMNLSNSKGIGKEDLIKSLNLMKPNSYQNSFKNLMKLLSEDNKTVNKNTNDLENMTYEELKELLDKLDKSSGGGNYLSKLNNIVKFKGGNIILNPTKKLKTNNKRIDILKIIKNLLNINKKLKLK